MYKVHNMSLSVSGGGGGTTALGYIEYIYNWLNNTARERLNIKVASIGNRTGVACVTGGHST
jgi:hypothetical protein